LNKSVCQCEMCSRRCWIIFARIGIVNKKSEFCLKVVSDFVEDNVLQIYATKQFFQLPLKASS